MVRLNEEQTLIESFFLHRSTQGGTEYLDFFLGKAYYRDIDLLFVYDAKYKQWFLSGPEFYNEAIYEKTTNKILNLKAFARKWLCNWPYGSKESFGEQRIFNANNF